MADSNDAMLMSEYRKLIDFCEADANFNPVNPLLPVGAMNAQHATGSNAVTDIPVKIAPFKVVTNERQQLYDGIAAFGVRIRNMAKASGASKEMLADMLTYTRKLRGSRAGEKAVDNPDTPENEALQSHSVSQTSYVARAEHLRNIVELAKNEPLYKPNENDLKTDSIDAYIANLEAKNTEVANKFVPVSNARALRDQLLYTNADSIVDVALQCKAYVAAALGKNSTLYQQIKGLKFPRPRRTR